MINQKAFVSTNKTKYSNIYFDLDNTLWDFKNNSEQTLKELFANYFPNNTNDFKKFLSVYYPINDKLWVLYRKGQISKSVLREKRFADSFKQLNINNIDADKFATDYITQCPFKTVLFPYSLEVLEYLKQKQYRLFLLTNGFKEVQTVKIMQSGLHKYFDKMITSEEAGYKKPHKKMFEYALKSVHSKKKESIMIGDDLDADIVGALNFGMDCVFFNPQKKNHDMHVTHEISSLKDLKDIL